MVHRKTRDFRSTSCVPIPSRILRAKERHDLFSLSQGLWIIYASWVTSIKSWRKYVINDTFWILWNYKQNSYISSYPFTFYFEKKDKTNDQDDFTWNNKLKIKAKFFLTSSFKLYDI